MSRKQPNPPPPSPPKIRQIVSIIGVSIYLPSGEWTLEETAAIIDQQLGDVGSAKVINGRIDIMPTYFRKKP
jgi:hypothetical protein